jgi:glycosyltransferase involved in cell wall biosynthesis
MRVLHVTSSLAAGRAGHHLRLLVGRLPHECEVVTLSGRPGAADGAGRPRPGGTTVAATLRAAGTPVHELTARHDHDLSTVGRLRRLVRRGHFDVVHTHLYRGCVQGRLAARLAGVPNVIATAHTLDERTVEGRPATAGVRALYLASERLGRLTIATSPAIARRLREWGVPDDRIATVPAAIDTAEFRFDAALRTATRAGLGIPPGTAVIGGVGRLEPGRRFDRLIRAVGEVPGAMLLLVGDGPARAALTRLAVIEGVADRVVFAGPVGHARAMLCAMDVFASPSEHEGSEVMVLEALAAGLPTVYARCAPLETPAAARAAVAGARRLTPHDPESLPRALRTEVLCVRERHGGRLPLRSAGSRYDADRLVSSVGRLYERITCRRRSVTYHFRTRGAI